MKLTVFQFQSAIFCPHKIFSETTWWHKHAALLLGRCQRQQQWLQEKETKNSHIKSVIISNLVPFHAHFRTLHLPSLRWSDRLGSGNTTASSTLTASLPTLNTTGISSRLEALRWVSTHTAQESQVLAVLALSNMTGTIAPESIITWITWGTINDICIRLNDTFFEFAVVLVVSSGYILSSSKTIGGNRPIPALFFTCFKKCQEITSSPSSPISDFISHFFVRSEYTFATYQLPDRRVYYNNIIMNSSGHGGNAKLAQIVRFRALRDYT